VGDEKWENFQVTDSLGTFITIKKDGKVCDEFIIGKVRYDQKRGQQQSYQQYNQPQIELYYYFRINNEDEVYSVKVDAGYGMGGFPQMPWVASPDRWRDKTIVNSDSEKWTKLSFYYPSDSSFTLSKGTDMNWYISGEEADSAYIQNYLMSLENIEGRNLIDKQNITSPSHKIIIEGDELIKPIELNGLVLDSLTMQVSSNQNPKAVFENKQLFSRLFVGKDNFKR
jgi:hypothetical protein